MQRCLDLAIKGLGSTAPNPMVGAVIVHNDTIIGEGYTSPYGGPHAEVNAIQSVKDPNHLTQSTLYVSLEPCAHFGKTPPCANLIVEKKIPRVVVGTVDSFSAVNGRGIRLLRDHGVEVITDVLEEECRELNKRFFTFHERKRPYIVLKWAQTKDGFMDRNREGNEKRINWITQKETKNLVHLWRSQESAILVGRKTIENDNPQLNVRLTEGNSPIRLVLDPDNKIDLLKWDHAQTEPTILFNSKVTKKEGNVEWISIPHFSIEAILDACYKKNIQSILVEGGKFTLDQFIQFNLWDEARVLAGKDNWEFGLSAPKLKVKPISREQIGLDELYLYRNPS